MKELFLLNTIVLIDNGIIFNILLFLIGIFISWCSLTIGCEYRSFSGGHKFIKAFVAYGWYQKFFTIMQSNNVSRYDKDKITYIGFVGVVISTILAVFIIPLVIYGYFFINFDMASFLFICWFSFNFIWGMFAFLLQGIDSIINRFL